MNGSGDVARGRHGRIKRHAGSDCTAVVKKPRGHGDIEGLEVQLAMRRSTSTVYTDDCSMLLE